MTSLEYATDIGLYVHREFLSGQLCASVCEHMRIAPRETGTILDGDHAVVDERSRKTKHAIVPESIHQLVTQRLRAAMTDIARHFGVTVERPRSLQFLRYDEGDFFNFHRDRDDTNVNEPLRARERQVSVVIFLNSGSEQPIEGTYGGGALQFYMPDLVPGSDNEKFTFPASEGTLVAFNPQVLHQVRPVTHGNRYTIVGWFV
jgi:SM-20-related protein